MKFLINSDLFEYDVRGLLQAFYPWTRFSTDRDEEDPECLSVTYFAPGELPLDEETRRAELKARAERAEVAFTDGVKQYHATVPLDLRDRKRAKTTLKQAVYGILSENAGHTLPWGTLSGIRPTKIAMDGLRRGEPEEEILRHMENDLLVSKEKAQLALDIAKREKPILSVSEEEGYSLYVGIPFCPTTCLYCSFASSPIGEKAALVRPYLDALKEEILFTAECFRDLPVHSVYFGGGTPTALTSDELEEILSLVASSFDLSLSREWTVEAGRPDSLTEEKLRMLKRYPVTRISVNPQTMQQKTLDLIGRRHTVEDSVEKYLLARSLHYDNINMDLILGLPGETEEDIRDTLVKTAALSPDSVTVHSLAVKRSSRLNLEKEMYAAYRMENTDGMMDFARKTLEREGLLPYYLYRQKNMAGNQENVGYARPGKEGVYNVLIMEESESIVALGAGASSKKVDRKTGLITRVRNPHDVATYAADPDEMKRRKQKLFFGD